ncbi:MAG TPA: hypothetical protein VFQ07_11265 [Candidatus Polarisedimenticolia bacterium]|nr:hypothetical protein [Candidatus Polarisedimenticolia bacterium]
MRRSPVGTFVVLFLVVSAIGLAGLREAGAQSPPFTVISTQYLDLNGDHDMFPDTGETGRVVVVVQNNSGPRTNAKFTISSSDPDVVCISGTSVQVGNIANGQTLTVGSLTPGQQGFQFRVSDTMQTISAGNPAHVDLCLRLKANGTPGSGLGPVCFSLLADLDGGGGGSQTFVPGPDGLPGTSDDGTVLENFDVDRDGDGSITVNDTFRLADDGTGTIGHGSYLRGAAASSGTTIGGIACAGYQTFAEGNPGCELDPDYPLDWHLHCPPGATNCPNVESGTCVGGCSFGTPADGAKALSGPNSLHMGAHFDSFSSLNGDTTHFRSEQAYLSAPLNLAVTPRPGDLQLSMFHVADLMDNNGVGPGNRGMCSDCGDVQIQVDANPDPAVDSWGFWDKLVPFQNVYDHKPNAFSTFGGYASYYCIFTPTDTGTAPPAPRGVHETLCYALGAWSHCGSARGTTTASVGDCAGPGTVDPSGAGVWVETRFDLASFVGQRVRLRWIGSTWEFDAFSSSYYEIGPGWSQTLQDDGWWLDNISLTGVITRQGGGGTSTPDNDPPPGGPPGCPQ